MEHYWWFALQAVPLIGNVTFRRLLEHFGTPERALKASPEQLASVPSLGRAMVASLQSFDYRPFAERECAAVARHRVTVIDFRSADYPDLLRQIPDPPPLLYSRGHLQHEELAIAVVGSRRASTYGLAATSRLSRELAERHVTVVSGLARGIDAAAHRGALGAGGRSIGVLGCGIDVLFPPENRQLFAELAERGAVISEFPMGTLPLPENFPRRNRIISGISRGVLVVEATERSGSLITARFALDQGREVFAIPGNISAQGSRGTHLLIKQGAKLVEGVSDILEEFPPAYRRSCIATPVDHNLPPAERAVCSLLADGPLHIDEIVAKSGLTVGELSAMLLRLELHGAVLQLPGKHFSLA